MDSQAQDIVTWAEKQTKPACKPAYKRLTDNDRILARQLRDKGKTQAEIAQVLGCTQQAVSDWLRKLDDTKHDASLYLAGQSLRMARNIVQNGLARDHIQALNGLGVLNQQDSGKVSITINGLVLHGTGRQDVIDAEVLSPQLTDGQGEGEQNT